MTQLQKLSARKLAKYGTPLYVMDLKSKRKIFIIVDENAFEQIMQKQQKQVRERHERPNAAEDVPDYRSMGLLWDHPNMTNQEFQARLKNPDHPDNPWAVKRLMEYAPSRFVTKIFSLAELARNIQLVSLRPVFKEAWSHAIQYWSKNP